MDVKLNERIVDFIRTETEQLRQELEAHGNTYAMAFEVNEIASRLGVVPDAISGALASLHGKNKIIGYRVIKSGRALRHVRHRPAPQRLVDRSALVEPTATLPVHSRTRR